MTKKETENSRVKALNLGRAALHSKVPSLGDRRPFCCLVTGEGCPADDSSVPEADKGSSGVPRLGPAASALYSTGLRCLPK